jgi:hypothetical protein
MGRELAEKAQQHSTVAQEHSQAAHSKSRSHK